MRTFLFLPVGFSELATLNIASADSCPVWPGNATPQLLVLHMKIYTAEEVAAELKVEYKTVLRLIKRGLLKAVPGIRHKRITQQELVRFLGVQKMDGGAA